MKAIPKAINFCVKALLYGKAGGALCKFPLLN